MGVVAVMTILNHRIILSVFLLLVSFFLTFLWVIINQIRVSIKGREWEHEEIHAEFAEIEPET